MTFFATNLVVHGILIVTPVLYRIYYTRLCLLAILTLMHPHSLRTTIIHET